MVATRVPDASAYGDSGAGQLVRQYLESKGMPYTPDNVRRALDANARDSTTMGPDPIAGLRNSAADTEPPSGRSKSVADKIEGSGNKPIDSGSWDMPTGFAPTGTDTKTTSAQPDNGIDVGNIGQVIAQGTALGALGAGGGYLAGQALRPSVGASVPPPVDVAPPQITGGDQYRLLPAPEPSPMDMAMQRAVQPAIGYDPSGANLGAVLDTGRMPPGVSSTDAVNAGGALPTVGQPPPPPIGEGNIPITPKNLPITPKVGPQPRMQDLPATPRGRLRLRIPG